MTLAIAGKAQALPSYAEQTSMPCTQCHVIAFGPQLTDYGRQFKLNGYVWGDEKRRIPLALMTVVGTTHTSRDLSAEPEHYSSNDNFAMNELTAFYAGRISKHIGAFIEAAYSGIERSTAWGAFDVRYANTGSIGDTAIAAGVSINNNPTVTDLWNTTPVWSFPYTGSELAATPAAAPILFDGISERVLGPTFYVMFNNKYYVEAGVYKGMSEQGLKTVGLSAEDNLHMDGLAPYWRAAVQFDRGSQYFSVGLLALEAKLRPDPEAPGTDTFTDLGVDGSYRRSDGPHTITANFSWIHEERKLGADLADGASDSFQDDLSATHFDLTYASQQTWIASLGLFGVAGSTNRAEFAPGDTDGSANGSPDSRGYAVQLEYVPFGKINSFAKPWFNVRLGLQYIGYQRFNGGSRNYDGNGRSARDNNTLFAFAWLAV